MVGRRKVTGRGSKGGAGESSGTQQDVNTPAQIDSKDVSMQDVEASGQQNTEADSIAPVAQMTSITQSTQQAIAKEPASTASSARNATPARGLKRGPSALRGVQRRTKAERDALEAAAAAKFAAGVRTSGRGGHDRGSGRTPRGRGRGRGGYMGSENRAKEMVASGPFSAGTFTAETKRRTDMGYGGGGAGGGGGAFLSGHSAGPSGGGGGGGGGGGTSSGSRIKQEAENPAYDSYPNEQSDSDDGDNNNSGLRNISYFSLISDGEDSDHGRYAPVRIPRRAHKKRQQPVSLEQTTQDVTKALGELNGVDAANDQQLPSRDQEVDMLGPSGIWHGAWVSDDSDEDNKAKLGKSQQTRVKRETGTTGQPSVPQIDSDDDDPIPRSRVRKPRSAHRPIGEDLQTQEERDEYQRKQADLRMMCEELGTLPTFRLDENGKPVPTDPNAPDADRDSDLVDARADRVYLFQFPPVLPDLTAQFIKTEEPDSPSMDRNATLPDAPPLDLNAPKDNTAASAIKVEDGADADARYIPQTRIPQLASGKVGKLRIYKSGRAALDWGGTALELHVAQAAEYLQDVLVMRDYDEKPESADPNYVDETESVLQAQKRKAASAARSANAIRGEAMGLGQIKGKFIVTPDWSNII